jgi:pimeloyl-ACP methyl ester carboxylesterase
MTHSFDEAVRRPNRGGNLTLADSRVLAWSEWGPPTGDPVLFLTGAGMARTLGFGQDHLEALDIRLIAPDRPGLGASSADPGKTLASVAGDIADLASSLGRTTLPVVAFSQGAPFAFAVAASSTASSLSIISGQDELYRPEFADRLPEQVTQMILHAQEDPVGFSAMLEGFAEPDGFYDLVLSMSSPEDRAVYGTDPFASAYRQSLREGFRQGPKGYVLDTLAALTPWWIDLGRINCPVKLWYGGKDGSPVHSPDFGQSLASRLPNASRRFFPEEGGALLWTRARDILHELTAAGSKE